MTFRERLIDFSLAAAAAAVLWRSWLRILAVGLPAALGSVIDPLGIVVLTAIVASFGTASVAAFGVATRIEAFAAIPMLAPSSAAGPVSGQSWGSGRRERVPSALRGSFALRVAWGALAACAFWSFGGAAASAFADDPAVVREAAACLRIVPLSLAGYGVVVVAAGACNVLGKPLTGLGYHLLRTVALTVPLAWVASDLAGRRGVFAAVACANVPAGALVALHASRWLARAGQEDCRPAAAQAEAHAH